MAGENLGDFGKTTFFINILPSQIPDPLTP